MTHRQATHQQATHRQAMHEGASSAADDGDTVVDVRVIPRAKHDEVAGERAGRLLVRTTAPPVDRKANEAVRRILADHLGVPIGAVALVRGATSRDKTFRITRR